MDTNCVRKSDRGTSQPLRPHSASKEDNVPEELPYDKDAPVIEIKDEDYGIFYIDIFEDLASYIDKTVRFKAKAAHPNDVKNDRLFVAARPAMTCCAEDIAFVGFPCEYEKKDEVKEGSWIELTATVKAVMNRQTNELSPVMVVKEVKTATPPEDEVAYFW